MHASLAHSPEKSGLAHSPPHPMCLRRAGEFYNAPVMENDILNRLLET